MLAVRQVFQRVAQQFVEPGALAPLPAAFVGQLLHGFLQQADERLALVRDAFLQVFLG